MKNRYLCLLLVIAMIVSFVPVISAAATGEVSAPTGAIQQGITYKIVSPSRLTTRFGAYKGGTTAGEFLDGGDGECVTDGWYLRSGYSNKTSADGLLAVVMTLDKLTAIGGIEIVGHSSTGNDMTDFDVQAMVNGEWVEVLSVSSNPFDSGVRTKMYTFAPVGTTQVRILINRCQTWRGQCKLGEVSLFEVVTDKLSEKIDLTGRVTANFPDTSNPASFAVDGDKSTFLQNFQFPGTLNIDLTTADNEPTAVDHFALYLARGNDCFPRRFTISVRKTPDGPLEQIGSYDTGWGTSSGQDSFYGEFDQTYMVYSMQVQLTSGIGGAAYIPEFELYQYEREANTVTPSQSPTIPSEPEGADPDYLTYTISDGKATVTGCDTSTSGNITIPYYLGGCRVTAIGDAAFKDCTNLTGVTIPYGVSSIGSEAFYGCSNLNSITLPEGLTSIGTTAFYKCSSLTDISIPDGVTTINISTFSRCDNLRNVSLPDSITLIDMFAFSNCPSLTTLTIPNGVTKISKATFYQCTGLRSVVIPGSVAVIEESAFGSCSGFTNVTYCGTQAQWNAIGIDQCNEKLQAASVQYHQYTNVCDTDCDLCGSTRIVFGHTYTNKCDTSCNRCGETRVVTHSYNAATCTDPKTCGICGATEGVANGHSYDASNKCACGAVKFGILTQPKTQKVAVGKTVKYTVKATGDGLKYQWQSSSNGKTWKNCSSSSATKATFSFTSKTSHSSNYYRCKITDGEGNVIYTDTVRLYVLGVTTQPKTQKVKTGSTVKFTVKATGAGKTYQWQVSTDGKTWKNCSSSSAKKATFTFTSKTSHSGNYYRCRIKDNGGNTVYTDAVKLYVLGITEQPVNKTVTKGKTAKFEVEATGASKTYQWQVSTDGGKTWKNCSSSSAKKATFSFTAKTSHNGNYYRCRVKDSGGNTVYTNKVKLTVK
ncbi:MAG: leucine-rich repeat protein [Oscillospiraceae bacterium]|nr:leucine-rich repeat protein [Oscillospiraceae bacterium]